MQKRQNSRDYPHCCKSYASQRLREDCWVDWLLIAKLGTGRSRYYTYRHLHIMDAVQVDSMSIVEISCMLLNDGLVTDFSAS
jgi:hypothetical protein